MWKAPKVSTRADGFPSRGRFPHHACIGLSIDEELLALMGWEMAVTPTKIDERPGEAETGRELTRRLARSKALVSPAVDGEIVIAADTIVVDGETLLGKPSDSNEARLMLERLRGRDHVVVTSIALRTADGTLVQDTCESTVSMRNHAPQGSKLPVRRRAVWTKPVHGIRTEWFEPVDRSTFTTALPM
jgi:hypothetical protein